MHFSLLRKKTPRLDQLAVESDEWCREFEHSILPSARHEAFPQIAAESEFELDERCQL